jgi:hypothetical protein
MPQYNFDGLSSYDFEILVRDLLQAELGIRLEVYKPGRDTGIDIRGYTGEPHINNQLIVQCKHFSGSRLADLLREMRVNELVKIQRLSPNRYILVTSLPLSPEDKDKILSILRPYSKSSSDILGREDINNLLGRWPEVEQQNFKLWLTSSAVLQRITHSKTFVLSEIDLDRIRRTLMLYVQNASFFQAKKILEDQHYCLIAGIPGIGKTTLAEILCVDYVDRGYRFVRISGDISEAVAMFHRDDRSIFYYDDFLGTTSLEYKFGKNEEVALASFIDAVRRSKSRLILTTREYILNQAKLTYERLDRSRIDFQKCVIQLADYTRFHRAQILYNHLYFSRLPPSFLGAIVKDNGYRKIVDHPNYNPRLIEWMTDVSRITQQTTAEDYYRYFVATLNHPDELWNHAFREQISDRARLILVTLISLPTPAFLDDVEPAFDALQMAASKQYGHTTSPDDFQRAIKELEGNFTLTEIYGRDATIRFHNPSINDFLERYVHLNAKVASNVLDSAQFFDQLRRLLEISSKFTNAQRKSIDPTVRTVSLATALLSRVTLPRARHGWFTQNGQYYQTASPPYSLAGRIQLILRSSDPTIIAQIGSHIEDVVGKLIEALQASDVYLSELPDLLTTLSKRASLPEDTWQQLLISSARVFSRNPEDLDDFEAGVDFFYDFEDAIDDGDEVTDLKWEFAENFEMYISRVQKDWLEDETDYQQLRDYADRVERLAPSIGGVSGTSVSAKLRQHATQLERDEGTYSHDSDRWSRSPAGTIGSEDQDMDRMFGGLLSGR